MFRPLSFSWPILSLIAVLYIGTCFTPSLFDDNEGLYAGAVREMSAAGNWLLPLSNGFPRVQKPPLVYWSMLMSTSILGWNVFALRLPNALATWSWIALTYLIFREWGGLIFARMGAVALASMLGVQVFTHLIQPEPFLAASLSLSFWALLKARSSLTRASLWILLFWIGLACGVMSKGLHGALWPLTTSTVLAVLIPATRSWIGKIVDLPGLVVFLILVLPWYLYMSWKLPGFLPAHFINEQAGALVNLRFPPDAKQLPLWQFYLQHLLFWMPTTFFLPGAIFLSIRERALWWKQIQMGDPLGLWILWVLVTFVTVSFSARQDYYAMTCWGMVAGFLAWPWFRCVRIPPTPTLTECWSFFVPVFIICAIGGFSCLLTALAPICLSRTTSASVPLATATAQRDTFADAISGISPELWAQFLPLLAIFGVAFLLAGGAALLSLRRKQFLTAYGCVTGVMSVPLILAAVGFTLMSPYFSMAEHANAIEKDLPASSLKEATVACEALPNTASSLLYYLPNRIHWVNAPFNNQYAQRVLGLGRDYYWNVDSITKAWRQKKRVYLILEEDRIPYWQKFLKPVAWREVFRAGTRVVICNQ